ncbi:MAG: hotdog fold thioesterase [Gammaproteobacteria bacterium]
MPIWFESPSLDALNKMSENTIHDALGIRFSAIGDDYVQATMPVDRRNHQPYGLLHGGASVVLAESLGSVGAGMCVDQRRFLVVGQEINANHLRSVTDGVVTGTARPVHMGRRSHVWEIDVNDDQQRLICISRLTLAVLPRKNSGSGR